MLEDYTRLFGEPPAAKPAGIAVLTDADDTRSRAEGDYAKLPRLPAREAGWDQGLIVPRGCSARILLGPERSSEG